MAKCTWEERRQVLTFSLQILLLSFPSWLIIFDKEQILPGASSPSGCHFGLSSIAGSEDEEEWETEGRT